NWNKLKEMILSNDVEKLEVLNDRLVRVYLKEEALNNDKYKEVKSQGQNIFGQKPPQYFLEVTNDALLGYLENLTTEHPDLESINIDWQYENDSTGQIISWIIMLGLFILVWNFMMRRMGGGGGTGGGPGQIFNIGRSK